MTNPDRPFRVFSNRLGCEVLVVPDGYSGPVSNPDRLVVYSEAEIAQLARDGLSSSLPGENLAGLALVHAIKDLFGGRLILEDVEDLPEPVTPAPDPEPEPPAPDPPAPEPETEPEPPAAPVAPVVVEPVAPVTVTATKRKKDTAPNLFDF